MSEIMLEIDNVSKIYPGRRSLFGRSQPVTALNGVSLSVNKGESYGLVGESGSGKTTLTRSILHLETPTGGAIRFQGKDLQQLSAPELRRLRARIQIVFQDPYASLNPRMSVHDIVTEPMVIHHGIMGLSHSQRTERAVELLCLVGLAPQHLHRLLRSVTAPTTRARRRTSMMRVARGRSPLTPLQGLSAMRHSAICLSVWAWASLHLLSSSSTKTRASIICQRR